MDLDYTRHYRNWHDDSDSHFEQMAARYARSLPRFLPGDRQTPILEIGCGTGFALGGLAKAGYVDIRGIDSDRCQIAAALKRGLPAKHVPVDETLAFLADQRDLGAVMAFDVIEHIPVDQQIPLLRTIHASLKPDGVLVCQVPNASSPLASHMRYVDWTHRCSFTKYSLDFVLFGAGFTDIVILEADPPQRPRLPFVIRRSVLKWAARSVFRTIRRLEYASEMGWHNARALPLTRNIIAISKRSR